MKKRVYSTEFKERAVWLSYQRDNVKELEHELGINPQRLYKCRKAYKEINKDKSVTIAVIKDDS